MSAETSSLSMRGLQEAGHGTDHDYVTGSPHLQHAALNAWMRSTINRVLNDIGDRLDRPPRALEVGAGHGPFSETLAAAGADVTVTEMSAHSAAHLEGRFRHNPRVRVHLDPDGDLSRHEPVDLVIYMSVLHHIPDYLASLAQAAALVSPGGAVITFQDPLYYPRRTRASLATARAAEIAWRLGQGDFARGVRTQVRRLRGGLDEANPSDMVEYHCVRDGVDELAVAQLLGRDFADVAVHRYWSTQAGWAQRLGARLADENTFGVVATHRR